MLNYLCDSLQSHHTIHSIIFRPGGMALTKKNFNECDANTFRSEEADCVMDSLGINSFSRPCHANYLFRSTYAFCKLLYEPQQNNNYEVLMQLTSSLYSVAIFMVRRNFLRQSSL